MTQEKAHPKTAALAAVGEFLVCWPALQISHWPTPPSQEPMTWNESLYPHLYPFDSICLEALGWYKAPGFWESGAAIVFFWLQNVEQAFLSALSRCSPSVEGLDSVDTSWGRLCPGKHDPSVGIQKGVVSALPCVSTPGGGRKGDPGILHSPRPPSTSHALEAFLLPSRPLCQERASTTILAANPAGLALGGHLGT